MKAWPVQQSFEVLSRKLRQMKAIKSRQTGKEGVKVPLFAYFIHKRP